MCSSDLCTCRRIVSHLQWPGEEEKINAILDKLSRVQDETNNSLEHSAELLRGHLKFCRCVQQMLQHASADGGFHLSHDSAVVSAGAVVRERLKELGKCIVKLQNKLHDMVQYLQRLGERGKHLMHLGSHHLWTKIKTELPGILQTVTLIISWIGKIIGFLHPVGSAIDQGAQTVHDFLQHHTTHAAAASETHGWSNPQLSHVVCSSCVHLCCRFQGPEAQHCAQ